MLFRGDGLDKLFISIRTLRAMRRDILPVRSLPNRTSALWLRPLWCPIRLWLKSGKILPDIKQFIPDLNIFCCHPSVGRIERMLRRETDDTAALTKLDDDGFAYCSRPNLHHCRVGDFPGDLVITLQDIADLDSFDGPEVMKTL